MEKYGVLYGLNDYLYQFSFFKAFEASVAWAHWLRCKPNFASYFPKASPYLSVSASFFLSYLRILFLLFSILFVRACTDA